jgi:hypothetical protein
MPAGAVDRKKCVECLRQILRGLKAAKNDAVSKQAGHELAFAHAPRLLYRNRFRILHV